MPLDITPIPLLNDNYAWLLRDVSAQVTAVVDPSEAAPVIAYLRAHRLHLDAVLNTHHHHDHTGGNLGLKAEYGCPIVGAEADRHRVAGLDLGLRAGDTYSVGSCTARILEIPGHTLGHIAFVFSDPAAVFCGDTLFSLGCGRLFEGTPAQMFASLGQLAALAPQTLVCCGHEYTAANAQFALTIEPDNSALKQRAEAVRVLRLGATPWPTVPVRLALELATNPFLRVPTVAAFAALRAAKDRF